MSLFVAIYTPLRPLELVPAHDDVRHCPLDRRARFGPRLENAASCTISQAPSCESVSHSEEAKQKARGGEPPVGVALRVHAESSKVLTESDREDIRAQVVVSGGGGSGLWLLEVWPRRFMACFRHQWVMRAPRANQFIVLRCC